MGTNSTSTPVLADRAQREMIVERLDVNFLVEAAAGTGKTTSLVGRMAALIASGTARAPQIAAVTFTRKAASELKARFVLELERALITARGEGDEERAARLVEGIEESGRCFIGTIHSFCARLLRERPVEAGIDPGFSELDEEDDARLRRVAFDEYVSGLMDAGTQDQLLAAGLGPEDLFRLFEKVTEHPDVNRWPAPEPVRPDFTEARDALEAWLEHIASLLPFLPAESGTDSLIPQIRKVQLRARNARDLSDPLTLYRIFKLFDKQVTARHKFYPGGKDRAVDEAIRWEELKRRTALPSISRFLEHRYAVAMAACLPAAGAYRGMRAKEGALNFGDLLLRAAALLRENAEVRQYFQDRYRCLLVDEFQDTDPVQAEVMLLLSSTEYGESDWRRCVPRPGSLFVVGDPKQSIYRFRRADIAIYNEVRDTITGTSGSGGSGEKLELSSNFRSRPELLDWVNRVFAPRFPEKETDEAPGYVDLKPGLAAAGEPDLAGIRTLTIPSRCTNKQLIMEYEPPRIARTIRSLVDTGATVTGRDGSPRLCDFGDFLVITMKKEHLSPFSSALDQYAIPHQVTGGAALGGVGELYDLYLTVRAAARPHDPLALVAFLKGGLFGLSDADLLDYRVAGGEFRWDRPLPKGLTRRLADLFEDAAARLRQYSRWLTVLPPVPALERIARDLGLAALAASREDGDLRAGSIFKAMEILRHASAQRPSMDFVIETLHRIVTGEEEHDGIGVRPEPPSCVRVMNLHKAKGLEAPVVFLATPAGGWSTSPSLHVVRGGEEGSPVDGYAQMAGPDTEYGRGPTVGLPPNWEDTWGPREQAFLEAELVRLLYVAATRAGSMLVISRVDGGRASHPWTFFNDHMEGAPELEDPVDVKPPEPALTSLESDEAGDPEFYKDLLSPILSKTYDKTFPSSLTDHAGPAPSRDGEEDALDRGTVIHALLEAAMARPETDLESLARSLVTGEEMSPGLADECAETVKRVMASDALWPRARRAVRLYPELPYTRVKKEKKWGPTLESGVMDLVFEEEDGWVIVDYKTGAMDREKYRPQLEAYKEAWESFGVGGVKEVGVYFVDSDEYVVL